MEAVRKELVCPGCGEKVVVRLLIDPQLAAQIWQCPHCKKMQKTESAAAIAAPPAA